MRPGQAVHQHAPARLHLGLDEAEQRPEEPGNPAVCRGRQLPPPSQSGSIILVIMFNIPGNIEVVVSEFAGVVVPEVVGAVDHGGDTVVPQQRQVPRRPVSLNEPAAATHLPPLPAHEDRPAPRRPVDDVHQVVPPTRVDLHSLDR